MDDPAEPVLLPLPRQDRGRLAELPLPLTSFIGRQRELAAVADMLRRVDTRLLTLTGPGGVGKTRLAIQTAASVGGAFPDGVWLVELAPVREPDLVASAIAQGLGIRPARGEPVEERLRAHLRDKRLLLLLDNFEHVVAAAPLVVELLAGCRGLSVMVTSRTRLRVSAEQEFPVSPLALVDEQGKTAAAEIAASEAVRLFVARARAVNPEFALTPENAATVAAICRRLDGLPLAVELAAARSKVLLPRALLTRLEPRLPLLTGGGRDLPARQQTMREAIAWSYDLLASQEQALFRRLSVFVGGFSLEATEAVGPAAGALGIDLLEGVSELVDHNLLRLEANPDADSGEPRYVLLETIREYGRERLTASGEEAAVREAHAAYVMGLSGAAAVDLAPPDLPQWQRRVEADIANIREALDWLQSQGRIEDALRLLTNLTRFWLQPPHVAEGRTWFATLLPLVDPEIAPPLHARTLLAAANLAILQRDYETAQPLGEHALALFRAMGDDRGACAALGTVGYLAMDQGRLDDAFVLLTEVRTLALACGCCWDAAEALNNLARVATVRGEWREAIALHGESRAEWELIGDAHNAISALGSLSWLYRVTGDLGRAYDANRTVLDYAVAHDQPYETAAFLTGFAALAPAYGQHALAVRLFAAAETQFRKLGTPLPRNYQRANDAMVAELRQRLGEAAFAVAWSDGQILTLQEAVAAARALRRPGDPPFALTPREMEVLRLLVDGLSDKEIAATLGISRYTASNHVTAIRDKLGVPSRAAVVATAVRDSLI